MGGLQECYMELNEVFIIIQWPQGMFVCINSHSIYSLGGGVPSFSSSLFPAYSNWILSMFWQLKIEREAGRVFGGWKEGKIYFAPTYKYSYNSDIYAGETIETQKKRRTPAWYI